MLAVGRGVVAVVLFMLVASSGRALAQGTPARTEKDQAQALLDEGWKFWEQAQYVDALDRFERAYRVYPRPKLHFNLAAAYYALGRLVEALTHYEAFLHQVPQAEGPEQWSLARKRVSALQERVSSLEIRAKPIGANVSVDNRSLGEAPLTQTYRFMPGEHTIVVTLRGHESEIRKVMLAPGRPHSETIVLLTEDEATRRKAAFRKLEAESRGTRDLLRRSEEDEHRQRARTRHALRLSGWVALGTGAALLALGGTFGALARVESAKVEDPGPNPKWSDVSANYDRAQRYRKVLYYAVGTGAALAVSGGVLLLLGSRGPAAERVPLTVVPVLGPEQASVLLAGRF